MSDNEQTQAPSAGEPSNTTDLSQMDIDDFINSEFGSDEEQFIGFGNEGQEEGDAPQDENSEESPKEASPDQPDTESKEEEPSEGEEQLSDEEKLKRLADGEKSEEGDEDTNQGPDQLEIETKIDGITEKRNYTRDELRDAIQMSHDYRQKTQALSDERKQFEQEMTDKREAFNSEIKGVNEDLNTLEEVRTFYQYLEKSDPDLYQEVIEKSNQWETQFHNPLVKTALDKIEKREQQFEQSVREKENAEIHSRYETQVNEAKNGIASQLEKLGVEVDWEGVNKAWYDSSMSVKEIIMGKYGDVINRRWESRAKVEAAKKEAAKKSNPIVGKTTPQKNVKPSVDINSMGWGELADHILETGFK